MGHVNYPKSPFSRRGFNVRIHDIYSESEKEVAATVDLTTASSDGTATPNPVPGKN